MKNEEVHLSLVFSRSGQKLSVRLPCEVALSANGLLDTQLASLIEKAQLLQLGARPDLAIAAG